MEVDVDEINEAEEIRRGENIAHILGLKKNKKGRYETSQGDKTALGLFRTMDGVVQGKINP